MGSPLCLLVPVLGDEVGRVDDHSQTLLVGQQHHLTDQEREREVSKLHSNTTNGCFSSVLVVLYTSE